MREETCLEGLLLKEPWVSRALKIVLYVVFAAGAAGVVTLPVLLETWMRLFYDAYSLEPGYRSFILAFLMVVAALGLCAVWEMIRIMRTIPEDPFVRKNVASLRRIGVLLLIESALFFLKCLYYATFLTMVAGFLFAVCGLFAFTLCNLFRQAVAFREENDLTI